MTLDTQGATAAIEEYFGSDVLVDEPTWAGVLIDQAPQTYQSAEDLQDALGLMHLRAEADVPPAPHPDKSQPDKSQPDEPVADGA